MFVRIEATYTDFDEVTATNSNGTVLKANSDITSAHLSIGSKF